MEMLQSRRLRSMVPFNAGAARTCQAWVLAREAPLDAVTIHRIETQRHLEWPGLIEFVIDRLVCIYLIDLTIQLLSRQPPKSGCTKPREVTHEEASTCLRNPGRDEFGRFRANFRRCGAYRRPHRPLKLGARQQRTGVCGGSPHGGGGIRSHRAGQTDRDRQRRPSDEGRCGHADRPRWFDNGKVDAVADIPNSAIAIAVHNMVRERNKIALLSGPGASSLTNELCSPNTVHFTYDTYALSKVTASAVIKEGGKSWFFVTLDYAFGHQLKADATHFIKELGGTVLGSVRHPTNTADFSSFALQAQSSKADVVAFANAGQDTDNAIKQSGEFGLVQGGQKLVGLLMFDTDVNAIGLQSAQGTYMTTASYWNMDNKTRAWSKKFYERTKVMPTMIHTGVYGSVLHYLKAIRASGTDDPAKVMAKMRELPIEDVFVHGGKLREDGRVIRDMYLAKVKTPAQSKEPWDYLEIVKTVKGEDAFRPVAESKCPLLQK